MYDTDLTTFDCHINKDNEPIVDIRFKGKFAVYESMNAGILLGELLGNTPTFLYGNDLFEFPTYVARINGNIKSEYDVCNVIFECYPKMDMEDYRLFKFVIDYIEYCSTHSISLSSTTLANCMCICGIASPNETGYEINRPENELLGDDNGLPIEKMNLWESENFAELMEAYFNSPDNYYLYLSYECYGIGKMVLSLLFFLLKMNYQINKCLRCSKWFVAKKADEKYCSRKEAQRTCKQIANYEVRRKREANSQMTKRYNCINTLMANRVNSAINEDERNWRTSELFTFREEAEIWKQQIKAGTKSEEQFIDWLNSFKIRKNRKKV